MSIFRRNRRSEIWKRPKLLRWWQKYSLWSITFEGDITWWCSDDVHHRERKINSEISLPKWPWRPYCWWYSHEDYYGDCITCGKNLVKKS